MRVFIKNFMIVIIAGCLFVNCSDNDLSSNALPESDQATVSTKKTLGEITELVESTDKTAEEKQEFANPEPDSEVEKVTVDQTTVTRPETTRNKKKTTTSLKRSTVTSKACESDLCGSGLVTEVILDCVSHQILQNGQIKNIDDITCDGGSWITVNGQKIQTTSGFVVTQDLVFNKHPSGVKPGSNVSYVATASGNSFSLNCEKCQMRLLN